MPVKRNIFLRKISSAAKEAMEYIANEADKRSFKFYPHPDVDTLSDEFVSLPTVTNVTKHGFYEQFAVLGVKQKRKKVILILKGRGETEEETTMELKNLSMDDAFSICEIADLIATELMK